MCGLIVLVALKKFRFHQNVLLLISSNSQLLIRDSVNTVLHRSRLMPCTFSLFDDDSGPCNVSCNTYPIIPSTRGRFYFVLRRRHKRRQLSHFYDITHKKKIHSNILFTKSQKSRSLFIEHIMQLITFYFLTFSVRTFQDILRICKAIYQT